ncbi:MAG: thiamine ABC transporter substrate binding subunit [Gammaproteobacteria bacterium]
MQLINRIIGVAFLCLFSAFAAQAAPLSLVIYTYDSFTSEWGPGPQVKKAFEQQCDCTVEMIGLEDGVSILNRLKLEGKNTRADIVLGIDTNLTAEARATGLFETHGMSLETSALPDPWDDSMFLPYDYGYFAFVYNQELLKNPPDSLKQLVEDPRGPTILIQDPRTSTPGLGLLLWIKKIYGERAPEAWSKLSDRIVTVSKGWSEAYGLFLKGEADMVLSYTTSPAYHIIAEQDRRFVAAKFSEGHYQQIEVAGLVKSSQQKQLGREFLAFMISDSFQSLIPTTNWMYPATLAVSKLPQEFNALIDPSPALLFDDETVARERRAWVNEWLEAMAK